MKIAKTHIADIGLVFAAFVWGSTFIIVKDNLEHVNAVTLVGYRFLLAATALALPLLIQKKPIFEHFKQGCIVGVFLWLIYVPQTVGLNYTTASNSGFITGLFVAFVPLLNFIAFKKKPDAQKTIAVLLSICGLWFLTGGLQSMNLGDVLTVLTAIAYAAHILAADRAVKQKIDPLTLSFQQFFIVGLLSFLMSAAFGYSFTVTSINAFYAILFLGLIPTALAFAIQLSAQRFTTPTKVALIFALEPVFAAMFAWTLGGELFTYQSMLGGLLIVLAMIVSEVQWPTRQKS